MSYRSITGRTRACKSYHYTLSQKSTTGYNALHKVITLPSGRILRDYTHLYKPKVGFQKEVDQELFDEMKLLIGRSM